MCFSTNYIPFWRVLCGFVFLYLFVGFWFSAGWMFGDVSFLGC